MVTFRKIVSMDAGSDSFSKGNLQGNYDERLSLSQTLVVGVHYETGDHLEQQAHRVFSSVDPHYMGAGYVYTDHYTLQGDLLGMNWNEADYWSKFPQHLGGKRFQKVIVDRGTFHHALRYEIEKVVDRETQGWQENRVRMYRSGQYSNPSEDVFSFVQVLLDSVGDDGEFWFPGSDYQKYGLVGRLLIENGFKLVAAKLLEGVHREFAVFKRDKPAEEETVKIEHNDPVRSSRKSILKRFGLSRLLRWFRT